MKSFVVLMCILVLFSLNGCASIKNTHVQNATDIQDNTLEDLSTTEPSNVEETVSMESIPPNTESPYIIQFCQDSVNGIIKTGQLTHTVLDMYTINNVNDLSLDGKVGDLKHVCVYSSDGKETVFYYPDFVDENGYFSDDIELLLLRISVKSDNAHSWTSADIEENPHVGGLYADPYIFRIDGMYSLQEEYESEYSFGEAPAYFSELDSVKEHPFAYRLEPGEETVITIGFWIGDDPKTGEHRDYSTMRIRIPTSKKEYFIYLPEK